MSAPMPKNLLQRAKEEGVQTIELNFSGGSDEGYLNVEMSRSEAADQLLPPTCKDWIDLLQDIEEWADEAFDYSGAGDGRDYGDDYVYDIIAGTVTHTEWYMERRDSEPFTYNIDIEEETANDAL